MKKLIFYFPFLLLLTQCTLSAKQEASLNKALGNYINARNECLVVGLVGFTYPELVSQYKSYGNESFKQKFDCAEGMEYEYIIGGPTLRSITKEGEEIHVLYEFDGPATEIERNAKQKFKLIAISENDGENWFFLSKKDYDNDTLCTNLIRHL